MDNGETHPSAIAPDRLLAECDVTRTRRSGPGGQNRNKVETAVVLKHRPTGLGAEASERRSQAENLKNAVHRLRLTLAIEVRRPFSAPTQPSPLWRLRCRGERIAIADDHADLPAILAEALDALWAFDLNVPEAAQALGITSSQLTKLLQTEPRAIGKINALRRERGLRPLR